MRSARLAISVEAFEAIGRTLTLGSVGYEAEANERGERLIWLEDAMVDRLGACADRARATATSSELLVSPHFQCREDEDQRRQGQQHRRRHDAE